MSKVLSPQVLRDQAERAATDEPKLERVMSPFANFAIAMSTICILAGGIASFHIGFCSVGGAAIGLGWPLCCLFSLTVALTMARIASAFPFAGGPYQWAAQLGNNGCGWVAGCFNLAGLATVQAAINVGVCQFVVGASSRVGGWEPGLVHPTILSAIVVAMTLSQALINHWGMRLTSWLTSFSGGLIIAVSGLLTVALLVFPVLAGSHFDLSRLVTVSNYSGPAGGNVWPPTASVAWLFALGLLLPAFTITGFDAAAQTAEETTNPERNVPRGIVRAVLISGLAGWIMLAAIVLAAPDMDEAAARGDASFFHILRAVVPQPLRLFFYIGIGLAQYICGLATLTASSRLAYALARDRGLPFSGALKRIGTHHTPSVAIWSVATVVCAFAVSIPYTAIASVCAIFLYIAYVLPTAIGLFKYAHWSGRAQWGGSGWWYPPLAIVCVLGCVGLIVIGMQPPNEIALWVVAVMIVVLLGLWFGGVRHYFRQPVP
ncbi:MAG: amino acid permease [Planctomycetia bacterium]|nr:amino acid permease [Planctomycetia bacterium]